MISDFGFRISDLEPERPAPRAAPRPSIRNPQSAIRNGFTLTELLVVIGIIVLVAVIAVPSFRAMTGGRSTEAAQNQISAVLARARAEALGLQEPRGVMFYRDSETGRVGLTMVTTTPIFEGITPAPPSYGLDLIPDRDPVLLPVGVGIQFVDDVPTPTPGTGIDRYIGFNTRTKRADAATETEVPFGGVILFDAKGGLMSDTYGFRYRYPAGALGDPAPRAAEMGKFLLNEPALAPGGTPTLVYPDPFPVSKIGFVLFNEEDFAAVYREGRETDMTEDQDYQLDDRIAAFGTVTPGTANEAGEEKWLSENGVPLLVNRYNGTLVRGE